MKALGAAALVRGPLLWQPARSWWNGFDRPGLVSKVWPSQRMVSSGGAGGNLDLANGGPPGGLAAAGMGAGRCGVARWGGALTTKSSSLRTPHRFGGRLTAMVGGLASHYGG